MTIKSVFFDIDGTLVDSNDMHAIAWRDAFREVGAEFGLDVLHDQIGKGGDMLIPTLSPKRTKRPARRSKMPMAGSSRSAFSAR